MDADWVLLIVVVLLVGVLVAQLWMVRELVGQLVVQEQAYRTDLRAATQSFYDSLHSELQAEREARLRFSPQGLADQAAAESPEWQEAHMTDEERAERERKAAAVTEQLAARGVVAPGPVGA